MQVRLSIPFVGGVTCVMDQDEIDQRKAAIKSKLASWKQRAMALKDKTVAASQRELKAAKAGVTTGFAAYKDSKWEDISAGLRDGLWTSK